jgi:hypothetical protein
VWSPVMQGGMPHGASPTAIPFIFLIIMMLSLQKHGSFVGTQSIASIANQ